MARVTPPMKAKGVFQLRAPFVADPKVAYTVQAVRTFEEIRARGTDPMTLIYTPVGLTNAAYESDKLEGALIVTLMSATGAPMYVPDTYIESYPDMGNVDYSWLVCSVSLGALPNTFDTSLLQAQVKSAVSDYIGVEPTVNIGKAAMTEVVSSEVHTQLVAARNGAIKVRDTDRARALRAEALVQTQLERIQVLEQLLMQYQAEAEPVA